MRLLLALLRAVPEGFSRALFTGLASLAFSLGIRRRVALENLAVAFPEKSGDERVALARENYLHLGRSAAEFLRSPALTDEELFARIDPGGYEEVVGHIAKTGCIVATAHLGNFELFGAWAARRGVALTIVTRRLKGSANRGWTGTRGESGVKELHSGAASFVKLLRAKQGLAILIDQNMLPKRAVFAPFFGRLAATTPAPAVLSERTGAPVMLALLVKQDDGRYRVHLEGPFHFERTGAGRQADVLRFTALLNARLEAQVRAHPAQWFWVHRRFKTRPPCEGAPGPARPALTGDPKTP